MKLLHKACKRIYLQKNKMQFCIAADRKLWLLKLPRYSGRQDHIKSSEKSAVIKADLNRTSFRQFKHPEQAHREVY